MAIPKEKLDWIDAMKGFALLAILLNHFVESFNAGPWFSNPSYNWPEFSVRMSKLFPTEGSLFSRIIQFMGWLGDMGPGVFFFVSGIILTISALSNPLNTTDFYKKRLLRIFPLYISIHAFILIIAIVYFNWNIDFLSINTFLSLAGLRFTNSLFFYMNPSWWFIWTLIQLYFVFPFLIILLQKNRIILFLLLTFTITILSRAAGVYGLSLSTNLYFWMTGLFAGTRLFEFSIGMFLGYLIFSNRYNINEQLKKAGNILAVSFLIYVLGFVASWTYLGSIVSNILITLGLSGIFYGLYELFFKKYKILKAPINWTGKNSFGIFLIHQPFLMYYSTVYSGYQKVFVLILSLAASFLLGSFFEKSVNKLVSFALPYWDRILKVFRGITGLSIVLLAIISTTVVSFLVSIEILNISKYVTLLLLMQLVYFGFIRLFIREKLPYLLNSFIDVAIILTSAIIILPWDWLSIYWLLVIFSYLIIIVAQKLKHTARVLISLSSLILLVGIFEFFLWKYKPLEVGRWGEFPALQVDSETVYSLTPNKTTHLRYNNYDYFVKTNSLGFASPEINLSSKPANEKRIMIIGDAFSMPEGMEYEYSYPFLLEKVLRSEYKNLKINVINAGVTGYGPIEEYAQLKKFIATLKPDIVINQFFVNEYSDINDIPDNKKKGIGFNSKFLSKKKIAFRAQVPLHASFLIKGITGLDSKYRYYKSLINLYEKESSLYSDSVKLKMSFYLDSMADLCAAENSEYLIMYVPGQMEVSKPAHISYFPYKENINDTTKFDFDLPESITQELCDKKNINYLNTKEHLKNYATQPLYFEESWHWNREGHKAVANFLADYLIKNNTIISIK